MTQNGRRRCRSEERAITAREAPISDGVCHELSFMGLALVPDTNLIHYLYLASERWAPSVFGGQVECRRLPYRPGHRAESRARGYNSCIAYELGWTGHFACL